MVLCDLAAIKMRIMAKLSGDPDLMRIFQFGGDPHRRTASVVTGRPEDTITKDERQLAKGVGFGFIYGMGSKKSRIYAKSSYGVDVTEAESARARALYFEMYKGVAAFHRHQDTVARRERAARTLSGRLRRWASDQMPLTELCNTPDQGTGADILKRAMARIRPHVLRIGADLVLSVHDELVVQAREEYVDEVAAMLSREMIAATEEFIAPVPGGAEAGVGLTWADKH